MRYSYPFFMLGLLFLVRVECQVYGSLGFHDGQLNDNKFRRQLSSQHNIINDHQRQSLQYPGPPDQHQHTQQSFVLPQNGQSNIVNRKSQHQQISQNKNKAYPEHLGTQQSLQQQFQTKQQQSNLDLHAQNFLALRNYANQQVGPHQELPQRSHINKLFQVTAQQPSPAQPVPSLLSSAYGQHLQPQQYLENNPKILIEKKPNQLPVPLFGTQTIPPPAFPSSSQFNLPQQHSASQQQQLPLQQIQHTFQLTPNLGIPVPQILPHLQSFAQQQQQQRPTHVTQTQKGLKFPQQQFSQTDNHFYSPSNVPVEEDYKQKLIQKHEQFVQKQYEKSQSKVKQLHEDFIAKQQVLKQKVLPSILGAQTRNHNSNNIPPNSRPVNSSELHLFSSALQKYDAEHPTTSSPIKKTKETETSSTYNKNIRSEFQGDTKYDNVKKSIKTVGRDELLKQLKAALEESPQLSLGNNTYDAMDLVLPNGERVQVIRTTDPNLVRNKHKIISHQLSLDEVAPKIKNDLLLPTGSRVQILRSPDPEVAVMPNSEKLTAPLNYTDLSSLYGTGDAQNVASSAIIQSDSEEPPSLEELAKRGLIPQGYEIEGLTSTYITPPPIKPIKAKATYVYLEEQEDGSFKIQGVKANGEDETKKYGSEVENILNRIQNGDIKLPPSVEKLTLPNNEVVQIQNGVIIKPTKPKIPKSSSTKIPSLENPAVVDGKSYVNGHANTTIAFNERSGNEKDAGTTEMSISVDSVEQRSSQQIPSSEKLTDSSVQVDQYADTVVQESENTVKQTVPLSTNPSEDLLQILKSNSLFAMAKYLRQSGLDSILNETGPYTIFIPTDKAFKNLLVQLGGPERAEEKFRANPRLLSGLLLHHVIPGAFEIDSLQDEMTGVSLAGTQLRVNQYTMHDQEWNDVTLTTINGAMVVLNKKDIKIPQGIAHAVDRVMFPLPIGDLLQTLQSDRENKFSIFLKILYASGLSEKLQSKGVKTFTVFAPIDKSFRDVESDTIEKLFINKEAAEEFAMKHIVSGSLFSAGMRFYQVKDSLLTGKTVILQKTSNGKIKVNDAQMLTSNIPATNGVIHALDGVLL